MAQPVTLENVRVAFNGLHVGTATNVEIRTAGGDRVTGIDLAGKWAMGVPEPSATVPLTVTSPLPPYQPVAPPAEWPTYIPPAPAVSREQFERLLAFLALPAEARGFFLAALQGPRDGDLFLVLADYLEENLRQDAAARFRELAGKMPPSP